MNNSLNKNLHSTRIKYLLLLRKTYNNREQTGVKIPKPGRNLPYDLKNCKNLNNEIKFL